MLCDYVQCVICDSSPLTSALCCGVVRPVLWGCSLCAVGLFGGLLSGVEFCIILLFDCVTGNARPSCVHLSPVQLFYLCVFRD